MSPLNIIVGISGSIAAYKTAFLVRGLIKQGHEVKVVMTPSAMDFISPLTLSTLSKNSVHTDVSDGQSWDNHVELGLWADLMVIAPCTANTMAKMSHGICDNMLLATYLSAKCPIWIAPAMDLDMWKHPSTLNNVAVLRSFPNHRVLNVAEGELASGLHGPGRMLEPHEIIAEVEQWQAARLQLKGLKAMVTAGPTHEHLDPVRYIGNPSTGKMGVALANHLADLGGSVDLILGPGVDIPINPNIAVQHVKSAADMYEAAEDIFPSANLAIFAAAVADYTPKEYSETKRKKNDGPLSLDMVRTRDIAKSLGHEKRDDQVTIGFALETDNALQNAQSKLERKRFNIIVLNSLEHRGAGFGNDTNKVTIIDDSNQAIEYPLKSKKEVAEDIISHYMKFYHKA